MVMIPNPGKDHLLIQGCRPITLSNIVNKLAEKLVAKHLQNTQYLFHHLQYGSRGGRSALDAMMILMSEAERARNKGQHVTILGEDIVSAFNNVRTKECVVQIAKVDTDIAVYVERFLTRRTFTMQWDGRDREQVSIDQRFPQGSPLSPVLWLIYLLPVLKRTQGRF